MVGKPPFLARGLPWGSYSSYLCTPARPTVTELEENAKEHGVLVADYVGGRIRSEGMDPARGSELLSAFTANYAEDMSAHGATRADVVVWIRAVEAAFDERLRELTRPDVSKH